MNGLLALPQWYAFMQNPAGSWLGFINAVYWLGMGVSFPVAAATSNRFGRKTGIYVGYVILVVGTVLQTAAGNRTTFILGRFFLGMAGAWYGSNVPLLISETAYPTHRGIASSLYNCGWYVGSLIAAWATFVSYPRCFFIIQNSCARFFSWIFFFGFDMILRLFPKRMILLTFSLT